MVFLEARGGHYVYSPGPCDSMSKAWPSWEQVQAMQRCFVQGACGPQELNAFQNY